MYLVDTNIFLEILLQQNKSKNCKLFLDKNSGVLNISDFFLHSIGVILFRNKKEKIFLKFMRATKLWEVNDDIIEVFKILIHCDKFQIKLLANIILISIIKI